MHIVLDQLFRKVLRKSYLQRKSKKKKEKRLQVIIKIKDLTYREEWQYQFTTMLESTPKKLKLAEELIVAIIIFKRENRAIKKLASES